MDTQKRNKIWNNKTIKLKYGKIDFIIFVD